MELLGALLVLAVLSPPALELVFLAEQDRGRCGQLVGQAESLPWVWERWEISGGRAALAHPGENGAWTIRDFPDSDWLPESGQRGAVSWPAFEWKRLLRDSSVGKVWDVYSRIPGTSDWKWWNSVPVQGGLDPW